MQKKVYILAKTSILNKYKMNIELIGRGVLYAVFCWTYIPLFVLIFDLIVILTKPTEYNV